MYGHTRNPWDLERTPGTSSSGAAAAIAAGLSTLDIGSDGGGSILVPSHYCGIYGMRPTESRVSMYGLKYFPEPTPIFREGFVLGPMARSVEDLRLALQVISGPDMLDPAVPPVPWREVFRPEFGSLRIAWTPDFPGTKISTEIRYAIEGLIQELARLGAQVEQCLPDVDFWEQDRLFSQLSELIFSAFQRQEEGKQPAKLGDYFIVLNRRDAIIAHWERFMEEWDVLICPVAQSTAPLLAHTSLLVDGEPLPDGQRLSPCTSFCLTALPSVVIPLSLDTQELPMGVLLVGKRWSDEKLLAIAALVSEITGGFRRPPEF
jgi:amidase